MARRKRNAPVDDGRPAEKLIRFRYEDWADESEPVPDTWDRPGEPSYHHFRARRRWMTARKRWATEHDTTVLKAFFMDRRDERPR